MISVGSNASSVITGLDPVIQDNACVKRPLDCRIKSGNDSEQVAFTGF
ncbi:MAG: hypothetical protein MI920_07165 [Kiloniellales bacterium]|nr:hypothetical protein [Kiloniellales bacterium]